MIRSGILGLVFVMFVAATASAQGAVANGAKVYADQKCSVCHAIAGRGNAKGALDDVGSRLSTDEIREWIVDAKAMAAKAKAVRKPEMKAYALAKDDLDALVAYLASLKKQ